MTIGSQIPVVAEKPLVVCGCRKFQLDTMEDHLCTCTAHSGAKKTHDWVVEQLTDLFRTTHKTKTQHVTENWPTTVSEVTLTLVLTDTYITLMIKINH
jgi:hypothetical protein